MIIPPILLVTYHVVASGGSDSNDGVSAPWATLQHAVDSVSAGDTIDVAAGSYVGFDMQSATGVAGSPITIHGEPGAMITQAGNTRGDGINVEGVSYVIVEGFNSSNMPNDGFRAAVCDHITFRNDVGDSNLKWGILTGHCDDLEITDNTMSNSIQQHGIYVGNSGQRPHIARNLVFGNSGNGIHMNADLSQGAPGIISNAVVEDNIIYMNGVTGGSGINCDGIQDSIIQDNLIYAEHASGISLYMIDAAEGAKNDVVVNNTIVEASDGRWALNINSGSTGTIAYNNIFMNLNSAHGSIAIASDSFPITSDYNAVVDKFDLIDSAGNDNFVTFAEWQTMTGQDAHSFISTPAALFANANADNYQLSSTSPAIDTGTTMNAPPADILGNARVGNVDIGAYEYCSGTGGCVMAPDAGPVVFPDAAPPGTPDAAPPGTPDARPSGGGADAGSGPGGNKHGGCGCSTSGDRPAGLAAGLALLAIALVRRRRTIR
jgi:MYXO-CTERM domain-containing protein